MKTEEGSIGESFKKKSKGVRNAITWIACILSLVLLTALLFTVDGCGDDPETNQESIVYITPNDDYAENPIRLPADVDVVGHKLMRLPWGEVLEIEVTEEWTSPLRLPSGMVGVEMDRLDKSVKLDRRINGLNELIVTCKDKFPKVKDDVEFVQYRISTQADCDTKPVSSTRILITTPSKRR